MKQNHYFNKRVHHFNINDVMHTVIMTDIDKILDYIYEIKDIKLQRKELEKYLNFVFLEENMEKVKMSKGDLKNDKQRSEKNIERIQK